jgi:hypothetical protein
MSLIALLRWWYGPLGAPALINLILGVDEDAD